MITDDAFEGFAKLVREARGATRRSIKDVSGGAKVSTRTIVALERDGGRESKVGPETGMAKAVARLAIELGQDPREWVRAWLSAGGGEVNAEEISPSLWSGPRGSERISPPEWIFEYERDHASADPTDRKSMLIGVLTDDGDGAHSQRNFYCRFVELVIERINENSRARIAPSFYLISDFLVMYTQLKPGPVSKLDIPMRAVVGVSESPYRRKEFGLEFIPIPGLEFRLSCLSHPGSGVTWEDINHAPSHDSRVRIMALDGEIGANYFQDEWQYTPRVDMEIVPRPIDFQAVAQVLLKRLKVEEATVGGKTTVLVCGEEWAAKILLDAKKLDPDGPTLVDLAATGTKVPRFNECIAIRREDQAWRRWITEAISDIFAESPMTDEAEDPRSGRPPHVERMAQIYAQYLAGMIRADAERVKARLDRPASPAVSRIPDYLLLRKLGMKVGDAFRRNLKNYLRKELIGGDDPPFDKEAVDELISEVLIWDRELESDLNSLLDEYGILSVQKKLKALIAQRHAGPGPDDAAERRPRKSKVNRRRSGG